MRVGGRGVAVGETVGGLVAVERGSVGTGGTTSVAVAVDVGVVINVGELASVGVQVGWRMGNPVMKVAVGRGGLNGLNAMRGFTKIIA